MDIECRNASRCNTKHRTSSASFESHFSESFGKCINEIRLPRACRPIDIDPQWSRILAGKCLTIMIDYTKENAALIIDKIRDVDIRDLVTYVDQSFLTLQIALPMPEIFKSRIIVVPIEVTIEISFSEPRMLK